MTSSAQHAVELNGIVKQFGDFTAVHRMDLGIEDGSFVTFLGPSGCGKTTTLRMIAGLTDITDGEILIKGQRINNVPIHKRNLGLVFQNYALFPHKTIFDNVAFGLRYRNVSRSDVATRVNRALDLVQLPNVGDRYPRQLSGGQQQRIAFARAIVIEPDVLLLDEPLSALDANLREDMRVELKNIQDRLGITTIFVTHDQSEALAMSDRIVVMSAGHVEQVGSPEEVYNNPGSTFVANFLGHSNILPGKVVRRDGRFLKVEVEDLGEVVIAANRAAAVGDGERGQLVVRAEKLLLAESHEPAEGVSVFDGVVEAVDYQGQGARYFVRVGAYQMQAINPIDEHPFPRGENVAVRVRAQDCVLLSGAGSAA